MKKHLFLFILVVCFAGKMSAETLDFTWTRTVGDNQVDDGNFSYSGKVYDAIKSWGDSWVGFNSNVTATSRSTYSLTEGTYVFTLRVQWRNENRTNTQVPKIVINNGSDYEFTHPNVDLSNGVAVDLRYFVTVPSTGSYTIKVVSVDGERDKFGVRSLTMPSSTISCVYTVHNLIMKVITINKVSTFELSHASSSITSVNNVNPANLNGGVTIGGTPTSDFNTSNWKIKDGKARKDIEWTTLPTNNQLTQVFFYAWIGSEIGGSFENFDISCDPSDGPSCTAPNHVDISGNWDYFVGETISLSAQAYSSAGTGSPIAEGNITGYQWKHNGVNIDGATSKTYSLTTTSPSDGGDYSCVVSTGATCSTESSPFGTKVYVLQCYTDGTTTYNFTRVGTDKVGTVEVPLTSGPKEFKIYAGASQYYGNNTSAVYSDISNYEFKGNEGNFHLVAGLGGTFTFTIDYTDNGAAPKVSVTYPRKTIYLTPGVWDKDGAKFAIYYFISETVKGWTDFMTANDCGMSAEIPLWNGVKMIAARINGSLDAPAFGDDKCYNKTSDITVESSKDYISITGWNNSDYTYGTFSPSTYTISFAGNGNSGGSMSNVTAIPCGEDRTLVANTLEKSGYTFTGWKTNVAISTSAGDIAADGIVPNEATIHDITQNITLTAQWTPNPHTLTWVLDGGTVTTAGTQADVDDTGSPSGTVNYGETVTAPTVTKTGYNFSAWSPAVVSPMPDADKTYMAKWTAKTTTITIDANTSYHGSSTPGTVTATWGSELSSFTAASGVAGYGLVGYYTGANDGTKIINADGTLVQNVTGYTSNDATPVWIYETSTLTLYPHYDPVYTVTVNVNNGSYGSAEADKASYFAGATVTITAAANIGYLFDEWTTSDAVSFASSTSAITTFNMPSSNVTVQANFDVNPCTNIYTIDCGSTANFVTPTGGKPIPSGGSNPGIYTDYYTGYHGSGYYDFKNSSNSEIYYKVHLPAAQYKFEVYTATDKYNQFLNVYQRTDGQSGEIYYGGYYYSKIIANPNGYNNSYTFGIGCTLLNQNLAEEDYIIGLSSEGTWAAYDQVVITANSNVFCQYTVSATATNGSVSGTGTYYQGEKVTLTATPSSGYEFDEWSTSDVTITGHESDNPLTFTMPGTNVSLTATFEASCTPHDITLTNDGHGSATASPTSACENAEVEITATPSGGYHFHYWSTNDVDISGDEYDNPLAITMPDGDISVAAHFLRSIIATGDANLGSHDGYAGNNASMSVANVVDPASKFDHKVLQITYTMNSADDESSYYGMSLPVDAGYSASIASGKAGMGFWYRTESTTDKVLTYFCIGGTGSSNQFENLLPATNGKWQYWYIETDKVDDNTTFGFYINGSKNGKSSGVIGSAAKFWLSEVEPITPADVTVNSNEEKPIPMVVRDLTIYQGGQVTNEDDILITRNIYYYRPAEDDGESGKLGNKLDQWYTFALPFTVSDVEVYDEADERWYDINAVYYSDDDMDQATNNPNGAGHYYLQYLKAENETAIGSAFAARWQYITPGHSEHLYAEDWSEYRYGYPKKDSAYIILFDSDQPRELPSGYWESNPTIRFVGVGPQTIDGVAKEWKIESDGEQYWMYANNTLHSFTLTDAYILNGDGTKFVLQESPTIRPFECYVQATASLKEKCAAISMRGFRIDNTTTGAESIQGSAIRAEKILRNGQLIIIRNGVEYDATGVVIR